MTQKQKTQSLNQIEKKSYSYYDIIKMESKSIYSSIGNMIISNKTSAPKFSFGTSNRDNRKKIFDNQKIAKIDLIGLDGNGPATYFPSTEVIIKDKKKISIPKDNPIQKYKYDESPEHKIGTSQRPNYSKQKYDYYKSTDDYIKPDQADLKRRRSESCVRLGLEQRWKSQRKDKITPGPHYDPTLKPQVPIQPKYTFGFRRQLKEDPFIVQTSTNPIVGPGAYFPPTKSQSVKILRLPADSRIQSRPSISFTKGPKILINHKNSIEQTYDIKTNTIMANYDFEYDGGKGLHSGKGWSKQKVIQANNNPIQRLKMKSYSIGKSTRQQKRVVFADMMQRRQLTVKIPHPEI